MTTIRQNKPHKRTKFPSYIIAICQVLLLVACATDEIPREPADVYFNNAMQALAENDKIVAQENLKNLTNQHPFSSYSEQALLEYAHLEFLLGNSIKSIAILDRFFRLHSDSEQIDYAYYLRGMISFSQDRSLILDYTSIDPAARDLTNSTLAYRDFELIVSNYPHSRFAADSRTHMAYIRNLLAQKEVLIGEQYLEREAWIAALNRGNYVLNNYIDSRDSVAKALDIMVTAYQAMGMDQQAQDSIDFLYTNFPEYKSKYRSDNK